MIGGKPIFFVMAFGLCFALAINALSGPKSEPKTEPRQQSDASKTKTEFKKVFPTKPLEAKDKPIRWSHAPFAHGDCSICHERDDPKDPGKLKGESNQQCLGCHDQKKKSLKSRRVIHEAAAKDCTSCHNPHNSNYRLLLHRPTKNLCESCHVKIAKHIRNSTVKHSPNAKGNTCRNCHAPHASSVQHLLKGLPSDICLTCHGKDGLKDEKGRELTNVARLLKEKKYHHEPIDKKDCTACHQAHGGKNHNLLRDAYPETFYAPFSKKIYAFCFECHKPESITDKTTTLTGFRDDQRNLHALHVNRPDRGRSCRVCHEVHASEQVYLMRKNVPFGSGGWKLEINYMRTKTGGRCTKTCHDTKEYKNK